MRTISREAAYIKINRRGIVEAVRLLLALAQVPYEDCRYASSAAGQGFGVDAIYGRDKKEGHFRANMNSLPVLIVLDDGNEWRLGQSGAILRFLAAKHEKFGINDFERAQIDAILEHIRDIQQKWYRSKQRPSRFCESSSFTDALKACLSTTTSPHRETDKLSFLDIDLPGLLETLESAIPHNNPPWLVGSEASVADVALYHLLGTPETLIMGMTASFFDGDRDRVRASLAKAPRLQASVDAFSQLDDIQRWETLRPETFA